MVICFNLCILVSDIMICVLSGNDNFQVGSRHATLSVLEEVGVLVVDVMGRDKYPKNFGYFIDVLGEDCSCTHQRCFDYDTY